MVSTKESGIMSRYGIDQVPPSTDVGPFVGWIIREVGAADFNVTLATVD